MFYFGGDLVAGGHDAVPAADADQVPLADCEEDGPVSGCLEDGTAIINCDEHYPFFWRNDGDFFHSHAAGVRVCVVVGSWDYRCAGGGWAPVGGCDFAVADGGFGRGDVQCHHGDGNADEKRGRYAG